MPKSKPRYVLAGPDDDDGLPQFWTMSHEWGDFYKARWYGEELWGFPSGELPTGTRFIMDMEDYGYLPVGEGDRES